MTERLQKTFIYGTFLWPTRTRQPFSGIREFLGSRRKQPDFAAEILREFGPSELVGKLYEQSGSDWIPAQWYVFSVSPWFDAYHKFRKYFFFDMQGSGAWNVLHFRNESDASGPYVAVAMKYNDEEPTWIQGVRQQLADESFRGIS